MDKKLTKEEFLEKLKTDRDFSRYGRKHITEGKMVLPPCHFSFQCYTRELSKSERYVHLRTGKYSGKWDGTGDEMVYYDSIGVPKRAISLMWSQRSVDTFLGLPFNIASYGLLLEIIAKEVNMVPDELIGNLGDTHLYLNHIEQAKEQIGRELELLERVKIGNERGAWRLGQTVNCMHCDEMGIPSRTREPFLLPTISINTEFWGPGTYTDNMQALISGIERGDFMLENYQSHPKIEAPLSN